MGKTSPASTSRTYAAESKVLRAAKPNVSSQSPLRPGAANTRVLTPRTPAPKTGSSDRPLRHIVRKAEAKPHNVKKVLTKNITPGKTVNKEKNPVKKRE